MSLIKRFWIPEERRDTPKRGSTKPLPGRRGRANIEGRTAQVFRPLQNRISSLAQALAPRAVRGLATPATLGKPLIRERLFYPLYRHLWIPAGQWLVCRADASPTEDPFSFRLRDGSFHRRATHSHLTARSKTLSSRKCRRMETFSKEGMKPRPVTLGMIWPLSGDEFRFSNFDSSAPTIGNRQSSIDQCQRPFGRRNFFRTSSGHAKLSRDFASSRNSVSWFALSAGITALEGVSVYPEPLSRYTLQRIPS